MNKVVLVFLTALTIMSCSTDSEGTQFIISNVEDVTMAATYKVDSTSKILIRYKRPTECDIFNGFYYDAQGYTRTVAIQFARMDQSGCQADDTVYEIPLNFRPAQPGTYLFRFWKDTNADGVDEYIETEAVVPE